MRLKQHVVISAAFSGVLHVLFRRWELTLSSFLVGVLLDADHLFDYFMEYGWPLRLALFFRASYHREYRRTFVPLHAWEWVPLAWLAAWLSGWNPWVTGAAAGWTLHMALDEVSNRPKRWAYFLVGRWAIRFNHRIAFPKEEL